MNKIFWALLVTMHIVPTSFAMADYEKVLVGTCGVVNSKLHANFYVRNTDRFFSFDFIDTDGGVYTDESVKHLQVIPDDGHGIKIAWGEVVIRYRSSSYKPRFAYDIDRKTAEFKHDYSCVYHWPFEPCRVYVERYNVKFERCNLDFSNVLDK